MIIKSEDNYILNLEQTITGNTCYHFHLTNFEHKDNYEAREGRARFSHKLRRLSLADCAAADARHALPEDVLD